MDPIIPYNRSDIKLVRPDESLAAIVGNEPMERTRIITKLWEYIKKNKLQNQKDIIADAKLLPIFDGRASVTMFEIVKYVNGHLVEISPE